MSEISCVTSTTKTETSEQAEQQVDVVVAGRLDQRPAEALVVEHRLDDDDAGQQPGELQHDDRERRDQRVAQRVLDHDAAEAQALEPRGADILLRHHLGHRGAGHARDVADAVDRHGHHRQGEIVEGDALRWSPSPAEPFSQPSQEAKMTVKMTPETYSGVAVVAIEATDSVRSVREPSRMPASTPISSDDRAPSRPSPRTSGCRWPSAPGQAASSTVRLERGRAAEIALQDAGIGRAPTARCSNGSAARGCRSRDRSPAALAPRRASAP